MTGRGALGQLQLETKLPQQYINYGVLGIVVFNFVTALAPGSPTFSPDNQADVKKRPPGPTNKYAPFLATRDLLLHVKQACTSGICKLQQLLLDSRNPFVPYSAKAVDSIACCP